MTGKSEPRERLIKPITLWMIVFGGSTILCLTLFALLIGKLLGPFLS